MDNYQSTEILRVSSSWKRFLPVIVATSIGIGFSLSIFFVVRWWETQDIKVAFRIAAEDRTYAIKDDFKTELAMLELVRSALSGGGELRQDEFRLLVAPFISYSHSIFSVEWVPCVSDSLRLEYEAAARSDGIEGFQITEMDKDGRMVRASKRGEYFPVYLIGPHLGNKIVYGFDIASEPTRFEALRRARDSGKTVASGRIEFVQDREKQNGFIVVLPVYEREKPVEKLEDRRKYFRGVVLGVFRPGDMMDSALEQLQPEGIDVCLYDPYVNASGTPFYFHASRKRKLPWNTEDEQRLFDPEITHYSANLEVAGHAWSILCVPAPDFIAARRTWWPWGVMTAGLEFTAMLAAYLLLSIDHRAHIEQLLIEKRRYARTLENKVHDQTLDIRLAQEEVIQRLVSASQCRDEETGMHIRRTGLISELLARTAGWSAAESEVIRQAAPMHDIGKIGIPDAVLRKPGKLTPEEFEVMKTHTIIGAEMLAGSKVPMLHMAQEIAMNHHERWEGGGYPAGLSGSDIPECARIVAIADVFDALTHDRVYRPALTEEEVLTIMRQGVGTHFDPLLLAYFFAHLPEFYQITQENPDELIKEDAINKSFASIWPASSPLDPIISSTPTP